MTPAPRLQHTVSHSHNSRIRPNSQNLSKNPTRVQRLNVCTRNSRAFNNSASLFQNGTSADGLSSCYDITVRFSYRSLGKAMITFSNPSRCCHERHRRTTDRLGALPSCSDRYRGSCSPGLGILRQSPIHLEYGSQEVFVTFI